MAQRTSILFGMGEWVLKTEIDPSNNGTQSFEIID